MSEKIEHEPCPWCGRDMSLVKMTCCAWLSCASCGANGPIIYSEPSQNIEAEAWERWDAGLAALRLGEPRDYAAGALLPFVQKLAGSLDGNELLLRGDMPLTRVGSDSVLRVSAVAEAARCLEELGLPILSEGTDE